MALLALVVGHRPSASWLPSIPEAVDLLLSAVCLMMLPADHFGQSSLAVDWDPTDYMTQHVSP